MPVGVPRPNAVTPVSTCQPAANNGYRKCLFKCSCWFKLGYAVVGDVARFVRDIIQPGAPIYCEFNHLGGKHRTTILKSTLGIVILEPREAIEAVSGSELSRPAGYPGRSTQLRPLIQPAAQLQLRECQHWTECAERPR